MTVPEPPLRRGRSNQAHPHRRSVWLLRAPVHCYRPRFASLLYRLRQTPASMTHWARYRAHRFWRRAKRLPRWLLHTPRARFVMRLSKRYAYPWQRAPRSERDWRADSPWPWAFPDLRYRWHVSLTPTGWFVLEVTAFSLLLPSAMLSWWLFQPAGTWDRQTLLFTGISLLPVAAWLMLTRLQRSEVLGRIWDRLPRVYHDWATRLVALKTRRLPYRWTSGTIEELTLRYAMKERFEPRTGAEGPMRALLEMKGVIRLFAWFAAPVYLAFTTLTLQVVGIAYLLDRPPLKASLGMISMVLLAWFVGSYGYLMLQAERIERQLDVDPAQPGMQSPPIFQGVASAAPRFLHSLAFRIAVPAVLGVLMTIAFSVFNNVLSD